MEYIDLTSVSPLLFNFAIITGFILIIIALLHFLAISFSKNKGLALLRNHSMMLAALGSILILIGVVWTVYQIGNELPVILSVNIDPRDIVAVPNGTPVTITVETAPRDFLQAIFAKPIFFEFALSGPGTNYSAKRIIGPTTEKTSKFLVYPSDIGENVIRINVTHGLHNDKDTLFFSVNLDIIPSSIIITNQAPIIEKISFDKIDPHPVNELIKIRAEATDPDNDIIYYKFLRISPYSDKALEIPPWVEGDFRDNTRYWKPEMRDIGENLIIVSVRDGDERSPYIEDFEKPH